MNPTASETPNTHPLIAHLLDRDAFVRHLQARLDLARTVEDEASAATTAACHVVRRRKEDVESAIHSAATVNDWAEARILIDATANAVAAQDKALAVERNALDEVDRLQRDLNVAAVARNDAVRALEAELARVAGIDVAALKAFLQRGVDPPAEPEPAAAPAAPKPQPPTPAPAAAAAEAPLSREDAIVAEVLQHQVSPCPDKQPKLPDWQAGGLITPRVRKYMASSVGPVAVAAVAAGLRATANWQLNAVSDSLKYLAKLGEIQRIERGIYAPLSWRPAPVVDQVDPTSTKGLTDELLNIFERNDQPLYFADIYARLSRPYDRGSVSSQLLRLVKKGDLAEVQSHADGAEDRRWARAA